ncbi:hypothetical protein HUO13_11795 [Saccharopolyspora erythraea]|uniref:hypothetical protein n=1 Tax=Saccharopolyspora erythraea TaxID=1836 RepID=UPI001BA5561A|nr:hypothetical protein [Saccharopolyspora erythraea]QUH01398.1 hypothetical protein HUO13_11795 [Saccharopolyspora erythraea]
MRRWYESVLAELVVAAGVPLLAIGLMAWGSYLDAYGPGGAAAFGLQILATLVWLSSLALHPEDAMGANFVALLALMFALGLTKVGIDDAALHERGLRTVCTVLDVVERQETTSHYTPSSDPDMPGSWSTTTTYYYDHGLRCDGGPVEHLTTEGSAAAKKGERLEIAYDPQGRLGPVPADALTDGTAAKRTAAALLAVAVLARVGGVVWLRSSSWRYRRRSKSSRW